MKHQANPLRSFALLSLSPLVGLSFFAALGGCMTETPEDPEDLGAADSALTAAQCGYFDINGKVQICHKTSSVNKPYTILRLSEEGCIAGHVAHGGDYVTSTDPSSPLYDPTCNGGGCLPASAPCDATLPCCDGSTCTGGVCVGTPPDPCDGVTCVGIDDCHVAGTCDSSTGICSSPPAADGTACDDDSGCTTTDACAAGVCTGSGDPCVNGGTCSSSGAVYTCGCDPGWTGTNCEIDIDECASSPCTHGECVDQINGYVCECDSGWTGTHCEIDIDECESSPCTHGECVDQINGYVCECNPGYTGTLCEIDIDECASDPCANGDCSDLVNGYECSCLPGWTGPLCDINIDECASSPCLNGAICDDMINGYTCECAAGWTGTNCDVVDGPPPGDCPCAADPTWQAALSAPADTTFCSGFNGPLPCGSYPTQAYGQSTNGTSIWIFSAGMSGWIGGYCKVGTHTPTPEGTCYLGDPGVSYYGITEAEAMACRALILASPAAASCN